MEDKSKKNKSSKIDSPIKKEKSKAKVKIDENKLEEKTVESDIVKEILTKEIIVEKKSGFNLLEVVIIMIITLVFGGLLGSVITYTNSKSDKKLTSDNVPSDLRELVDTYNKLVDTYYKDLDKQKLLDAGIKGMIDYLGDAHSNYLDNSATEDFNSQVNGTLTGIGSEIRLTANGGIEVSKPFKDGPAEKAGLKPGDLILEVDGKSVASMSLSDVSKLIKGKANTKVSIKFKRGEEESVVEVTRKEVDISSVEGSIIELGNKKVGMLKITVFAANTFSQFEKELMVLEGKGIDSLIIDVRNNSGGYLDTVTDIASLFMDKSKLIYQLDTKGVVEQVYANTNKKREYPISVLVNKASASASEILAAALLESYGASVVGTNTYGKGTVQKAYTLESGATIKYTVQKWLTPNGNWIDEVGLTPTLKVEMSDDYYVNPSNETDNQLQEALKILVGDNK